MQNDYVEDLEKRCEELEEQTVLWRSIAEASCAFAADVPRKNFWCWFRKRHHELRTILFHKKRGYMSWEDGYSVVSPQKALDAIQLDVKKYKAPEYFSISTYFGKRHFPTWDCDSSGDLFAVENYLRELSIGYLIINSSRDHYWVIADLPKRKIREACMVVRSSNLGDQRHVEASWNMKEFVIRAFDREDGFISVGEAYLGKEDDDLSDENGTYKPHSWLFKQFHQKLKEYYGSLYPEVIGNQLEINDRARFDGTF
jgi:hypothetical protein